MKARSIKHRPQQTMIVISAGSYLGASFGLKVCGPICACGRARKKKESTNACSRGNFVDIPCPQEKKSTYNITDAVSDQIQCRNGGLFGVPGDIGGDQTEQGDKGGRRGLSEIIARQATRIVVQRQSHDEDHPEECNGQPAHRDQDALSEFVAQPPTKHEGDDLDGSTWRAVQQGLFGGVTERNDLCKFVTSQNTFLNTLQTTAGHGRRQGVFVATGTTPTNCEKKLLIPPFGISAVNCS